VGFPLRAYSYTGSVVDEGIATSHPTSPRIHRPTGGLNFSNTGGIAHVSAITD